MRHVQYSGITAIALTLAATALAQSPPANDNFANRQTLEPAAITLTDTSGTIAFPRAGYYTNWTAVVSGSTREANEPNHAGANPAGSVWYTYTPPTNGEFRLTAPTNNTPVVAVYTGNAVGSLTAVAASTNGLIKFSAAAGTSYHIAVASPTNTYYDVPVELIFFPPPANDDFNNAIVLSPVATITNIPVGGSVVPVEKTIYDFQGYTLESSRDTGESSSVQRSVWYKWTAPRTGYLRLDGACALNTLIDIGQGTPANFTNVVSSGRGTSISVSARVLGEQDYYFRIWDLYASEHCAFNIHVVHYPEPANNNFTNRQAVPFVSQTDHYELGGVSWDQAKLTALWTLNGFGADRESGEAHYGNSAWYSYTPAQSGNLTIAFTNNPAGAEYDVMTGSTVNALTDIWYSSSSTANGAAQSGLRLNGGTPYTVRAATYDWPYNKSVFEMNALFHPAPANDDFVNRQALTTTMVTNYVNWDGQNIPYAQDVSVVTGSTFGAAGESGEPNNYGRSIWYSWTPTHNEPVTIQTTGSILVNGQIQDTWLGVYTGAAVSALTAVANNDDANGLVTSLVSFNPTVGTDYKIKIDSKNAGITKLNLTHPYRSANDNFTNASPITLPWTTLPDGSQGGQLKFYGIITNATAEVSEPSPYPSVWYNWTPDFSGPVTCRLDGNSVGYVLYVYTGNAINALTAIAASSIGSDGRAYLNFNATAGTTYRIGIKATAGAQGAFSLEMLEKTPSAVTSSNNDRSSAMTVIADSLDSNNRYGANVLGDASSATLEAGETNALIALQNAGVELNDVYTNTMGSNSLWWSYTAQYGRKLAAFNSQMVAYVRLRSGLGYDPCLNLVNSATRLSPSAGIQFTPTGAIFSNNASLFFPNRPHSGGQYRAELSYTYLNSSGSTYNTILGSYSGSLNPLVVRNSDGMLGIQNSGTFTPCGFTLAANQEYYLAVEANGTQFSLWVNRTNAFKNLSAFDMNTYYLQYVGAAAGGAQNCGVKIRDFKLYQGLPSQHLAVGVWEENNMLGLDDDIVTIDSTAGTTYQINATPLSFLPGINLAANKAVTQSSTYAGAYPASYAVDGNTGNFSHTYADANAWLEVDLGQVYQLTSVEVWNRADCCQARVSNFYILVSDTPFPSQSISVTNSPGVWSYYHAAQAGFPSSIDVGRSGRYVRLQLAGTDYLNVAELKVFNQPAPGTGINLSVAEFWPSAEFNDPHNAQTITFTPEVRTYTLPNGTVSTTNMLAAASGSMLGANLYNGERNVYGANGTVWFKFQSPATGTLTIDTMGSDFDSTLMLTSAADWYNYLAIDDNSAGGVGLSSIAYNITAGTTYYLQLGGKTLGRYTLNLIIPSPPTNDNFAAAAPLTFASSNTVVSVPNGPVTNTTYTAAIASHNHRATAESGERELGADTGIGSSRHTVWWLITAPASGYLTVDTSKSSFPTQIGIKPYSYPVNYGFTAASSNGKLVYYVTQGSQYRLAVDGTTQDTGMGGINMDLTLAASPSNDLFGTLAAVTFQTNVVTGTVPDGTVLYTNFTAALTGHNIAATAEGGERDLGADTGISASFRTVWWLITAPASGYLTIDATQSTFLTQVGIKPFSYPVNYGFVGASSNGRLVYYVTQGGQYRVAVEGTTQDAGFGRINLNLFLEASPANDLFDAPQPVTFQTNGITLVLPNGTITNLIYTATLIGYNIAATIEGGERDLGADTGVSASHRTAWWSITAPASGYLTVDATKSTFLTQIGIKPFSYPVNYGFTAASSSGKLVYYVTQGSQFRVAVEGTTQDAGFGIIDLVLRLEAAPVNDNYPGTPLNFTSTLTNYETIAEFTITNLTYVATDVGHNLNATIQGGEYLFGYLGVPSVNQTVWWSFTPLASGNAEISLEGSLFDTSLRAGSITSVNSGAGLFNDDLYGWTSGLSLPVTSGTTYQIDIDGKPGSASGGINLTVRLPAAPANDLYANRQVLTLQNSSTSGNQSYSFVRVAGSTTQADNENESLGALNLLPNRNVWYECTPTQNGTVSISLESLGNHALAVFTVFNSGFVVGNNNVDPSMPDATVTFTGTAGTAYKILVDGSIPGPFALTLKQFSSPANDNFANRIPLTNGVTTTGSAYGASRESGEPGQHGGNGSVWYSFTATCTGQLEIDTDGSASDTILGIYTGNAVNSLTFLRVNNDVDGKITSRVRLPVTPGVEYEIAVASASAYAGDFKITPHLTCDGWVEATPASGNFSDPFNVWLSTPGNGTIFYSVNEGDFQPYSDAAVTTANMVGVMATNGVVTKTNASGWGNGGFISTETISGDGFAEAEITQNNTSRMFGLDAVDSTTSYTDIDYAIYFRSDGYIDIYEAGIQKVNQAILYNVGDRARVTRVGSKVSYYLNGKVIYTSSVSSSGLLHFDGSIYDNGGQLGKCYLRPAGNETGVWIAGGDAGGNVTLTAYSQPGNTNTWNYHLTAKPPVVLKGKPVTWTNLFGVAQQGLGLVKTSGGNNWNAGAVSAETANGDCSVDFIVVNDHMMIGLDSVDSSASYTDIQQAFHVSGMNLYIYQNGGQAASFGPVALGDRLRVERRGATMYYFHNDALKATYAAPAGPLHVDISIYYPGYNVDTLTFFQGEAPALYVVPETTPNTTRFTTAAAPESAPSVTGADTVVIAPVIQSTNSTNYRFRNFRNGFEPSADVAVSLQGALAPLQFIVPGPIIYTPDPITVASPSGLGGVYHITFPNGTITNIVSEAASVAFPPQGGGIYSASLYRSGLYPGPTVFTNLSFVVNGLALNPPSTTYGVMPFTVTATNTYPMSIYYTFAAQGTLSIPYTGPIQLGNTNVTIRFMGTRPGFSPQFVSGTYAYSPNLSITPGGLFSNATTFTIAGGVNVQYQVGNGPWEDYAGPFTLDGIPGGSDFIRAYFPASPEINSPTNTTPITFKVATPVVTPPGGPVDGEYTVTASTATTNATIYYAMGDAVGSMPLLAQATNVYTGPMDMSGSRNFIFVARKTNYLDSAVVTNSCMAKIAAPSFVTPSGTSSGPATITVASGDSYGGQFLLTSPSGTLQTATTAGTNTTFSINESGDFVLLLRRTGSIDSDPVTNSYNFVSDDIVINPTVPYVYANTLVSFNWDGGNPKAPSIYFTLDGGEPTTNSTRYVGAFVISNSVTVTALGLRSGYTPKYLTNAYTFLTAVSPAPPSGTYNNPIQVTLTNPLAQTIYYKINSDPMWTTYAGPFPLNGIGAGSVTVLTRYDHALYPGPTNLFSYLFKTADPVVEPASTNFTGDLTITATDATDGATIYYAMGDASGANASVVTNVYTGPLTINSTRHFLFEARRNGYQNSAQIARTYSSPLPAPVFVTPAGIYSNQISITVQSALIDTPQTFVLTYPSGALATNNSSGHIATFNVNETGEYQLQVSKANWLASPVVTNTYTFQTTDLAVNPAGQTFSDPLTVTATQGNNAKAMTIFYSTDGSTPTSNGLLYTSPLIVSNTTTLRFLGYREGYLPQYVDRTYTYAPGLVISPLSGTNHQAITVTLTPYNTNSTIYYQINSDPWQQYSSPLSIDGAAGGTAVVRAYTVTGPIISPTNTVSYTFQVSNLTVTPASQNLSEPINVTAATATPGADIYYANGNDGGETPAAAEITTLYTGLIAVTNTKVLIFAGRKSGYLPSSQVMRIFSAALPAPSFVTPSDMFTNQTAITVQSGLIGYGAIFQITAPDGSVLAQNSASDTASCNINASGAYQLKVSKANWLDSVSVSQSYNFQVQDLKVAPASGTFNTPTAVTARSSISNPNPLQIYYTTDGSIPTTNSSRYTGEIVISNSISFQWLATRDGYGSQFATNSYLYVPGITFSPGSGTYSNAISVSLNTPASNAQLFYSTNAADWSAYTGPFVIDGINAGTGTLRAYYTNGVLGTSPTNSFTIHFLTAAPSVSPTNLTLSTNVISVTAQSASTNAAIYYSANSTALETSSLPNLYTGPLSVSNRTFMVFQSAKPGYQSSAQVERKYIEKLPSPTWLTSGNHSNWINAYVELPRILTGVSMVMGRPDGSSEMRSAPLSPTTGKPTASFIVNDTGSCAMKAIAADWEDSDFVTNSFGFYVGDLSTTPDQLYNTPGFQVTAGSSLANPKPLVIYYTSDGSQPDANANLYIGPIPIAGTTTFKWLATRQGYFPQYWTNTYTFVAPLTVSPAPGTYSNAITVSLTSPAGEGIVYSLNGMQWENYAGPLTFDGFGNGVLTLRANYTGGATNTFLYTFKADPPSVTPGNQTIADPITLTAANGGTVGANVVYFEGDVGGSTATTNRTMMAYTGPITVSASRSYLFQTRKANYLPSDSISRTFTSKLPAPSVLTTAGPFTAPVSVQVQSGLPGYGGVYRMVDPAGITNQISSESPTTTFQINGSGTYHFSMQRAGWIDSDATDWTAAFHVADLLVSPNGGVISAPNTPVTASGSASNPKPLTIYYSLNGTAPTTNSSIYSQPILINSNTTITWLATRPGYALLLQTNAYLYVAGASINPSGASYSNAQPFTITPFDPTASIFYRTNSSDWLTYTGPFVVDGTTLIQFYTDVAGQHSVTNSLNATFSVAPLTVSPASQNVLAPITLTASTLTDGATILYGRGDMDGNLPDSSRITNVYLGQIIQGTDNSAAYVFKAVKPGYADVPQVTRTYTAKLPLPTSALGANITLVAPVQNTITAARPSQFLITPPVYYPGNGSSSNLVVTYSQPGRYGYKAVRNGWLQSDELVVNVSLSKPDNFSQRQDLVLISIGTNYSNGKMPMIYSGLGDNAGATGEPGDWDGTYDENGVVTTDPARVTSLWYRWVAPTNGLASFSVANNRTGDTNYFLYAIHTGSNLGSLDRLVLTLQPIDLQVSAGTEYQIAVYSGITPGLATEFNLLLNFYPTPINDEFVNPITLTMRQTYSGYTHGASSENGEPAGQSTWWKLSTTLPGTLEVPLSAGQATMWQGSNVAALLPVPLQYWTDRDTRDPELTTNNFFFRLEPSGAYYLRIAGEKTVFSFTPRFHTSPPHDNFPNTLSLGRGSQNTYDNYTIGEYNVDSTSLGATLQPDEPADRFGPATVWYQWTAPEEGAADITVYKTYYNPLYGFSASALSDALLIHAYTGNTFADLAAVPTEWNTNMVIAASALPGDGVPATNTTYEAAQILPGATVQFTGNTRYTETGVLWWKWVAPYSGWVEITPVDSGNNYLKVQVFTGDRYEDLVPQTLYSGLWKLYARAGETYFIKVHAASFTATPNNFSLKIRPDALIHFNTQPGQLYFLRVSGIGLDHRLSLLFNGKAVNDRFADALEIPLTLAHYENGKKARTTVRGRLIGATAESFETNAARTVWYHFTAPVNGYSRATLEGNFSTSARVFAGSNPSNLVELNPVQFAVASGGSYYIQVADNSIQDYKLELMTAEVPGNDILAEAPPLQRTRFKAYNDFATLEPSEPTKTNGIGGSVWWKYAPSQMGSIYLECTNKTVVLWQGSNLLGLTPIANNANSAPIITSLSSNSEYRISFDTRPGIPAGDFEVKASFYPIPANDDFINAENMVSRVNTLYANGIIYTYTAHGYTFSASTQVNEPLVHNNSVWYRWTAPTNMLVKLACELTTCVYVGDNLNALTPIGEKAFSAIAGQSYSIAVSGAPSEFTLTLTGAILPYNDLYAAPIPLTNGVLFYNYGAGIESYDNPATNNYSVWWTWNSAGYTNLYLHYNDSSGPDRPLQTGGNYVVELRVYGPDSSLVYKGTFAPRQMIAGVFLATVPAVTNTSYRISVLSQLPTSGQLTASGQIEVNSIGSQNNPDKLVWWEERPYLNGTISSTTVNLSWDTPEPYWYLLNLPWDGYLLASQTNVSLWNLDRSQETAYTPLMPVTRAGEKYLTVYKNGESFNGNIYSLQPPTNDVRSASIAIPMVTDTNSGAISMTASFNSYNLLAQTEDDLPNSVWYHLYIPAEGRIQIRSLNASLYLIPTDAASAQNLPAATLGRQQVISSGGELVAPVQPGYYYLVHADTPGKGTVTVTYYARPANDDFTNASNLTAWNTTAFINGSIHTMSFRAKADGATAETGEPPTDGQGTLWYKLTAPVTGRINLRSGWGSSLRIYTGTSLNALTLLANGDNLTIPAGAGDTVMIQVSTYREFTVPYATITVTEIENPQNNAFVNAIALLNSPITQTNINGTNYYLYEHHVPAGFWPAGSSSANGLYYIRNWYRIEADNLVDVWVNGWNNSFTGPTAARNHAYADFAADGPIPYDPRNSADPYDSKYIGPDARREVFPRVWGQNAYEINVPWTWNYAAHRNLMDVTSTGDNPYAIRYTSLKDERYKGLFDLTAFPTGPNITYLYAAPENFVYQPVPGTPGLRMSYTFVLTQPSSVKLTPVFPVGREAAAESVDITVQKQVKSLKAYTYQSTLESGEPSKPGSGGGSVWWKFQMPYAGFVRVILQGAIPVTHIWKGTELANLTPVAGNYSPDRLETAILAACDEGDHIYISTDRGDTAGEFDMDVRVEPPPANTDPDHAVELVPINRVDFENGTNWNYSLTYTIYPTMGSFTNNDLWYKLAPPASARLTAETPNLRLYSPLSKDIYLLPPSRTFYDRIQVSVVVDTNLGPAAIYYTIGGTTPSTSSIPYTVPIVLTNTTTVKLVGYRNGATPVYRSETYLFRPGIQLSSTDNLTNSQSPINLTLTNPVNDGSSMVYRTEGGEWQTYSGPVQVDGLRSGEGYLYYTTVLNGKTNPVQYTFVRFQAPPPSITPVNAADLNGTLTITATPERSTDTVSYYIDDPSIPVSNRLGVMTGNKLDLQPRSSVTVNFYLQRSGYLRSEPTIGTYSWSTNSTPSP